MFRNWRTLKFAGAMSAAGACLACASLTGEGRALSGIDAGNAALMESFKKGDAAAIARLYTADGMMLPPNAPIVSGAAAIEQSWKAFVDSGAKEILLATDEIESHRNSAAEVGHYTIKGPDGTIADQGKYIVLWRRDGGTWRLHRDIWNSSAPPQPR